MSTQEKETSQAKAGETAAAGQPAPSAEPQPAASGAPPHHSVFGRYSDRARVFAEKHPTAIVIAVVGGGMLVAAEFTVGALVGIGASLLIAKKIAPERRQAMQRRSEELLAEAKTQGQKLVRLTKERLPFGRRAPQPPPAPSSGPAAEPPQRG